MTIQQTHLQMLIAYEIGVRGEVFNAAVIFDTIRVLQQYYGVKALGLMITDEHPTYCGISEAIQLILADTYSEAAIQLQSNQ